MAGAGSLVTLRASSRTDVSQVTLRASSRTDERSAYTAGRLRVMPHRGGSRVCSDERPTGSRATMASGDRPLRIDVRVYGALIGTGVANLGAQLAQLERVATLTLQEAPGGVANIGTISQHANLVDPRASVRSCHQACDGSFALDPTILKDAEDVAEVPIGIDMNRRHRRMSLRGHRSDCYGCRLWDWGRLNILRNRNTVELYLGSRRAFFSELLRRALAPVIRCKVRRRGAFPRKIPCALGLAFAFSLTFSIVRLATFQSPVIMLLHA